MCVRVCAFYLSTQSAESRSESRTLAASQGFALSYQHFNEQRHEEQHLQVKVVNRGPEQQQAANEPFGQSGTR